MKVSLYPGKLTLYIIIISLYLYEMAITELISIFIQDDLLYTVVVVGDVYSLSLWIQQAKTFRFPLSEAVSKKNPFFSRSLGKIFPFSM
jgi:hypothetical protein